MLYEANFYQMDVEGHVFWVAESKALKGCAGQGETFAEAAEELEINEKEWIVTAKEFGIPIPVITAKVENQYSGKVSLRISPYVHQKSADNAKELGVSLNQYFNDAIVTYNEKVYDYYNKELIPANVRGIKET